MATTKLTDAQRVVLAAAATRESGLILPTPRSLGNNRGTLGVILKSLVARELVIERPIVSDEEVWRDTAELGRTTLVISTEGLKAIGIEPIEVAGDSSGLPAEETRENELAGGTAEPRTEVVVGSLPRTGSKLDALISALRQPTGATVADLMQATGWQAHSVRGAMSGALKKKLGLALTSELVDGRGRVYRVTA